MVLEPVVVIGKPEAAVVSEPISIRIKKGETNNIIITTPDNIFQIKLKLPRVLLQFRVSPL